MTMQQLEGKTIKISARSITIKEDGKTAGVIRNVCKFLDLQPRDLFEYSGKLRKSGMIRNSIIEKNLYIIDGKIYYINDLNWFAHYDKYIAAHAEAFPSDTKHYNERKKAVEEATANSLITVINGYQLLYTCVTGGKK